MTPVFNLSIVGWMAGSIVFAMLADRIGRRPATILAAALFGGFTLAIPLATNLIQLGALRFCAAFGLAADAMAIALISDYVKVKRRALFVTLLFLGYTAGFIGRRFARGGDRASISGGARCSMSEARAALGLPRSCSFGFRSRCAIWC